VSDVPVVSVIIPAYNAEAFLAECLDSILAQDYPAKEVIVVDDGSRDRTKEICQSYAGRVVYIWQENSGTCSVPRNNGLAHATGAFVTFLDADDVMSPGKLTAQVGFLQRHSQAVAVLTDYQNFDTKGPTAASQFQMCPLLTGEAGFDRADTTEALLAGDVFRSILARENFSSACSPLYRRAVLDSLGGFDVSLPASEDFHLNYRVALVGSWGVLKRVGFMRRLHDSNMTWNRSRMLRYLILSRAKLLEIETSRSHRDLLRRALRDMYGSAAVDRARARERGWLSDLRSSLAHGLPVTEAATMLLRCFKHLYVSRPLKNRNSSA
jgi:glycosyltransferase involved in cell wall biosynthesis